VQKDVLHCSPFVVLSLISFEILGMIEPWPKCQPEESRLGSRLGLNLSGIWGARLEGHSGRTHSVTNILIFGLSSGARVLDPVPWVQCRGSSNLDPEPWILDPGCWTLGPEFLGPGMWILDPGTMVLDPGLWIQQLGTRILDLECNVFVKQLLF